MRNDQELFKFPFNQEALEIKITNPLRSRQTDIIRFSMNGEDWGFCPITGSSWREPKKYAFVMQNDLKYWRVMWKFHHWTTGYFLDGVHQPSYIKYKVNHRLVGRLKKALERLGAKVTVADHRTFMVK
jgi:hypothetical protein